MSRKLKELMVNQMGEGFSGLQQCGCVVVGFRGLAAAESNEVRRLLAASGARMMVVRNRLFAIALERMGAREVSQLLDGPSAVITAADPVQAARAAGRAAEDFPALTLKGGYVDGHVLDEAGIKKLATLPPREVLLTQVLTCMQSPAQRFANCLCGAIGRLATALRLVRDKKQQESSGS